jgi:type II secretory pathway component GspD/PulD (secretin)
MKTLCSLICVFNVVFGTSALASEHKGFLIKTEFNYQGKNKGAKSESSFVLDSSNKSWTTLATPKDGIALLGRVASNDTKFLEMEYIVVDTNEKNAVISTPAIRAKLGEVARIKVGSSELESVQVSLLATPAEDSTEK